nr:ATP phosphoribosyltransferase regulatory subunit [Psychrobacter sp. I-STPA10]
MSDFSDSSNTNTPIPTVPTTHLTAVSDTANIWLLPDGVTDLLSDEAQKQEMLRYKLTQRLVRHGYELLCPPMIEYTESLLNNASEDLKRQTFKIIDQLTGRLMGVRADITPQILRIDAHLNQHQDSQHIARYCYAGHVIHTLPSGLFGSRTPLQLGAEIFGCANISADIELLDVLIALFDSVDIQATLHVDIGQVAIFKRLCQLANLSEGNAQHMMSLYANKALPELKDFCQPLPLGADFYALAAQGHDMTLLRSTLSATVQQDSIITAAMDEISHIKQHLEQTWQCQVSIDITELSGYHYHTGLVFNVYLNNESQPVARGGHFEGMVISSPQAMQIQSQTPRPATGFSLDLTRLQNYIDLPIQSLVVVDYESYQSLADDVNSEKAKRLQAKIDELRGEYKFRVVKPLSAEDSQADMTHRLIWVEGDWQLEAK